jgi:O-antigen ligase
MIFFAALFFARGANKGKGAVIIVIFVLIILSVSWFGWAPIIERFERIKNTQGEIAEMRAAIWKDSVNIIRDFPLTGTGFGSFVNIYPKYRTISGDAIAEHAHNDYIELVSDGGGVALFLCTWFLLAIFYKSFRVFLKRREMYSIYLFIAAVAGIMSILFHSLTDFNLHIGANGLYFFFLAGLAVSAANTRMHDGLNDTYLKEVRLPLKGLIIPVALIFSGSLIFNTGVTAGKFYF